MKSLNDPVSAGRRDIEPSQSLPASLLRLEGDSDRCLLITSARRGEGKSFVTTGLGWVLSDELIAANSSKRVLLIDANLRSPTLHQMCSMQNRRGLADVLAETLDPVEAIQHVNDGLSLLPAGGFGGVRLRRPRLEKMQQVLGALLPLFERIIVDAPAVLEYRDALTMAPFADAVLLVVQAGETSVADLRDARAVLEKAGGRVAGVIMNGGSTAASPMAGRGTPAAALLETLSGRTGA
ncbi:MAG: CpsD/CapB family tyrosine-protein kinase [Bryobacterales bacterium]|nr:CpsD/CapB family tyrosine-protein kinase [Bryobacterales bacterium]